MPSLVLAPLVEVYRLDRDAVVLLSDRGCVHLRGDDVADVVAELAGGTPPTTLSRVDRPAGRRAVERALRERGLLVSDTALTAGKPNGLDPRLVLSSEAGRVFGSAISPLAARWRADVRIVITDSFLAPEDPAPPGGRPWLLVKLGSESVWVSPPFGPDHEPCWECTRTRVLARDDRLAGLWYGGRRPLAATGAPPTFSPALISAAAVEIDRQLRPAGRRGALIQITRSGRVSRHPVLALAHCEACAPLLRHGRRAPAASPPPTWTSLVAPLLDDVTGIVAVHDVHEDPTGAGVAVAVTTYADPAPESQPLPGEHPGPTRFGYGSGFCADDACRSAVAEGIERYCAMRQRTSPYRRATLTEIGLSAIDPNQLMQFSVEQLADGGTEVPKPYTLDVRIDWCTATSVDGARRWLALACCERSGGADPDSAYCVYDSTGTAVGLTRDDAVVSGFLEVVERDAVAIWWYNRVPRPEVDVESFGDRRTTAFVAWLRDSGASLRVFDVTADLDVPTFVALSVAHGGATPRLGFGAHFDPRAGLRRALLELAQAIRFDQHEQLKWAGFDFADQPQLAASTRPPRTLMDFRQLLEAPSPPRCAQTASTVGAELLVHDCTRADVGVPCVKVILPGFRIAAPRFAPGRLFDVPVRMGWLQQPRRVDELNPEPLRM
jgi:ribosomal protein S12 methylthiotransferase accessory factor